MLLNTVLEWWDLYRPSNQLPMSVYSEIHRKKLRDRCKLYIYICVFSKHCYTFIPLFQFRNIYFWFTFLKMPMLKMFYLLNSFHIGVRIANPQGTARLCSHVCYSFSVRFPSRILSQWHISQIGSYWMCYVLYGSCTN